jgi:hypothetical protein
MIPGDYLEINDSVRPAKLVALESSDRGKPFCGTRCTGITRHIATTPIWNINEGKNGCNKFGKNIVHRKP